MTLVTYLKAGLVSALVTVLLPIQGAMWATFGLVCLNAGLGVLRAWRHGEKFCGRKLLWSLWFALSLALGLVATQATAVFLLGGSSVPMIVVTAAVGAYLLSSIMRSLGLLSGSPLFAQLDERLKSVMKAPSPQPVVAEDKTVTQP